MTSENIQGCCKIFKYEIIWIISANFPFIHKKKKKKMRHHASTKHAALILSCHTNTHNYPGFPLLVVGGFVVELCDCFDLTYLLPSSSMGRLLLSLPPTTFRYIHTLWGGWLPPHHSDNFFFSSLFKGKKKLQFPFCWFSAHSNLNKLTEINLVLITKCGNPKGLVLIFFLSCIEISSFNVI